LVAKTLSERGGSLKKNIFAFQGSHDHLALQRTEIIRDCLNYTKKGSYRKHGFLNTLFSVKSTFEYGLFLFPDISVDSRRIAF
jgi:hypothetical protein